MSNSLIFNNSIFLPAQPKRRRAAALQGFRLFRRDFLLSCLWLLLFSLAYAQDVQVRTSIGADSIGIQDQLQLTIHISGADSGEAEVGRILFRDFDVVSGPNVSTQFQWINGRSSNSKSISYLLLPKREGILTIEAVPVTVRGKQFNSEPTKIRVSPGGKSRPNQPSIVDDPFGRTQRPASRVTGSDIFITAELDRETAYAGQQVTLSYHLYTRVGVNGLQLQESPTLNGFWVEDLEVATNPPAVRKIIDGQEYAEYVIKKQALFPTSTGKLKIESCTFAISVRTPGDFFGFFSGSETVYRKSKEIVLDTKPLPAQGKPEGFNNAVGSFSLTGSLDKSTAATGDAVALRVKLEGRGNLKMIPDLTLPALPEFTVFSSKRAENIKPFEGGVIGGDKSWDYVIVPKAPGQQSIPALSFSYFDPQKEKYETISTPVFNLAVARGSDTGSTSSILSGIVKQDLTRQGSDINFIKLSAGVLKPPQPPLVDSIWFYLLALIPLTYNIALFIYNYEQAKQSIDMATMRGRKARRVALTRLKLAIKAGKRDARKFYDEAATALSGYLSDRFGISEIAVTGDILERTLGERSISPETIQDTIACMQDCDFGRFVSPATEKIPGLSARIVRVIDSLERAH